MSDSHPDISVVVPVYNGAAFVVDAVRSIEEQGPRMEIIVVDDGSTDETRKACEALSDQVRYCFQSNAGPAAARNRGIELARAPLLAFLDVDDVWVSGAIQRLDDGLRDDPELDVLMGKVQLMVASGEAQNSFQPFQVPFHSYSLGTGLFRRRAFGVVGLFDEDLRHGEDVDWILRAREAGVRVGLADVLVLQYRRHGGNMTYGVQGEGHTLLRMLKESLHRRRRKSDATGRASEMTSHPRIRS